MYTNWQAGAHGLTSATRLCRPDCPGQAVLNAFESRLLEALAAVAGAVEGGEGNTNDDDVLLQWDVEDDYGRALAEAVCQYYGLRSTSRGAQMGGACADAGPVWVLRPCEPLDPRALPRMRLTEYLASTSKAACWRDELEGLELSAPLCSVTTVR